ncbi:DUF11 domain-containing protein [Cloacibacterium caeni]|uniref:DUF11 domain-containing protein n=1 Tax=Cloacibacterium caeni TaxID=2004710 RepID=UPI001BCD1434|nr:DUF11 domain-containing protein [Cloacibacterium caeni]
MNKTLNFKTFKTFLQLIFLVVGVLGLAQTYPALEFGNVTPSPNTNTSLSFDFQKDTNNNTATNLVNYTSPSVLTVSYNVTATSFTNGLRFGAGGAAPFYTLMNAIGNAGSDNTQYTSFGVPTNGTGIDIASNYAPYISANLASAGMQPGNGRVKLGELTITLSRGNNNPILHFKGLGGASGSSFTAEFNIKSILNSAGAEILSTTNLVLLTGTNLNVDNTTKIINNDYTGATDPATTNTARGSVRFQNNDIRTIVLEVYGNRNGTAANIRWSGADDFLISISAGESDLRVTKTVSNATPTEGSNIVFTVTASNLGASNNSNVTVNDLLPSGYTYFSHTASTGTYVPGTGVWTIGNLNDQANATLTITAIVNATGNYNNTATISTTSGIADPNTTNNTASVSTTPVITDSDGDGVPDSLDLDDDNDGILDTAELYCDTTTAPNVTYPATNSPAAAPLYAKQLLFFDWSGVTLSPTSPSATKSVVYNGVTYTATISNYTSVGTGTPNAMVGNDILTWIGPSQMVGRYYNVNSTTFKEALYIPSTGFTGVNSFNISVTASKDGVAYPVDFVFFDAETTNKSATQTEQIKFTNNTAGTIELLEKTGTGTIGTTTDGVVNITGIGTNTVTLNETETSNVNALLFVKGYSPSVKVDITTSLGSQQGVGFAVRLYCDTDNDGTPNYLDTDSDGDGCPDAVEGGDYITQTMLNGSNAIGSNISGTLNSPAIATVDSNGVPVITNTGSTFNVDGQAQGQTAGSAYTSNPAAVAGTASSDQTICWNTTPSAITLTGYTGTIQWQSSADNVNFTNISGATSASYFPGTLTSTTYYRAIVSSVGGCTVTSNTITITVNNCIDAVNDTYSSVTPGTSTTSVIANDKNNSGTAAVIGTGAGQVSIRTATDATGTTGAWPAGFTLNADGTITVAAGTAAGSYTLYYTICNQTAGTPCDTAAVTITVFIPFCYKPAQTSGTILDTNHGITALGRAGADNSNWPMVRKGAWTALEAKTKGFVVNRMASSNANVGTAPSYTTYLDEPVNSSGVAVITNPVVGMMFYDTRTDCLKINIDGTRAGWKCFNTQACPD